MGLLLPALAFGALLMFSGKPSAGSGAKDNTIPTNVRIGEELDFPNGVIVYIGPDIEDPNHFVIIEHASAYARENPSLIFNIVASPDSGVSAYGIRDNNVFSYFGDMGTFEDNFGDALHFTLTGED